MREPIVKFRGVYRFLSNFYPCPMRVFDDVLGCEVSVPSTEHGYQADKTVDLTWRKAILEAENPGKAKDMGQDAPLRPDWSDAFKVARMVFWLRLKFQDRELREKLLSTEDAPLVEGNTWHDTFWGVCTCAKHKNEGLNYLGRSLMKVRQELLKAGV